MVQEIFVLIMESIDLKKAEVELDVFNLNLARVQADVEIDRRGLTRLEDRPEGWFKWAKNWLAYFLLSF